MGLLFIFLNKLNTRVDLGVLLPIYRESSKSRRMVGTVFFFGTIVALNLLFILAPNLMKSDGWFVPFSVIFGIGTHLFMTLRCIYCYRAFFPTEKSCAGCGRSLADSGGKKTGA
jgi:hypothetical protein